MAIKSYVVLSKLVFLLNKNNFDIKKLIIITLNQDFLMDISENKYLLNIYLF